MIIKDVDRQELRLTKTRLSEIVGRVAESEPWGVGFAQIRKAVADDSTKVYCTLPANKSKSGKMRFAFLPFHTKANLGVEGPKIGCRTFSLATFAKILKAAGVKKAKPRRKK